MEFTSESRNSQSDFRRMNLQAGEMIKQKLSPDLEIVRLLSGRIPWYKHIFEVTSCYSGFQPKNHHGSPGKPRETTGFAKNVTQFYITGNSLKVDVQAIQNERLKPPQQRAVWQAFLNTVVSAQLEQFQKCYIRPQEPKNGNAFIEMSPKKTPLTTRPHILPPLSLPPFPLKIRTPSPPSAKRRGRLQRGNERWRLERYSATSFLEGGEPTTLGWLFGRRRWRFVFFKNVPKMAFEVVFLCLRFDWYWSLKKNKVVWGNLAKPWNFAIWKPLVFVSDFGDAKNSSETATTGQLLHLAMVVQVFRLTPWNSQMMVSKMNLLFLTGDFQVPC